MLEAVTIIIDRLASHPEDFFGDIGVSHNYPPTYGPRFSRVRSDLDVLVGRYDENERPRLWYLTEEEKAALREAYTNACRERFQAETLYTLLNQEQPKEPTLWSGAVGSSGTLMGGTISGSVIAMQEAEARRLANSISNSNK
jgi:hypothetical protein